MPKVVVEGGRYVSIYSKRVDRLERIVGRYGEKSTV